MEIGGPVDTVELRSVGTARGKHAFDQAHRFGGVLHPRAAGDDVVGVDIEDEFAVAGQRLLTGRRVFGRGRGEGAAPTAGPGCRRRSGCSGRGASRQFESGQ